VRTRMPGGVGGEEPKGSPLSRLRGLYPPLPVLALFGHGTMSELSPLTGAKRKSDLGAVRSAFDPERT
jgi:hypothetical protein